MKARTNLFLLLTLVFITINGFARRPELLRFAAFAEQTGFADFRGYGPGLGTGLSAGTEFYYRKKKHFDFLQTADLSGIYHSQYGSSFILSSLTGIRAHAGKFSFDLKAGPGYLLFHNYSPMYRNENGVYKKTSGIQHKFSATATLGISYQIKKIQPYLSYSMMAETPFIRSSSPVLPHRMLELGVYIHVQTKNNEK